MLVTLRLTLADGRQRLVSRELEQAEDSPRALLERMSERGRIALGDRESVDLAQVADVELEPPAEPQTAPSWGPGLRDEDVAAALQEDFEPPS